MNQIIKNVRGAGDDARRRIRFNTKRRLPLTYVREEPKGWPLTRPATRQEWAHVLRVMIMRRIPLRGPIHRTKLIRYVSGDLEAASAAGRIYVDQEFMEMRMVYSELNRMIAKAKIVRTAPMMDDPEMASPDLAIYRTEYADRWLSLVPVTVKAVVDYLPTTNVLDLMVQALVDDDGSVDDQSSPPASSP